jgi:hypothetical protein
MQTSFEVCGLFSSFHVKSNSFLKTKFIQFFNGVLMLNSSIAKISAMHEALSYAPTHFHCVLIGRWLTAFSYYNSVGDVGNLI